MVNLITLIVLIPFINFFLLSVFGQFIGLKGSSFLSFFHSLVLVMSTLFLFFSFSLNQVSYFLNLGNWINSGLLTIEIEFMFDSLSVTMLLLVSTVATIVHWYSLEYLSEDPQLIKFLSYLSLFTFFMIVLVTAADMGMLLIGWEGVGICSFLLISFWNTRLSASKAAIKAIIFNRFGDLGFFIGLSIIVSTVQSLNFHVVFQTLPYFTDVIICLPVFNLNFYLIDIIFFFISFGVIGKSAQIGLHVWLLDAMEGPTPVSALIHAATMVTAGVFVLIRLSFILEFSVYIQIYIAVIGSITALTASVIAVFQTDIKSIIAYSTCSQLGYMVLACGISSYSLSFFHLFNHGFFKALLFLSSGVIIHNFMEEQDIRKMGGLFFSFPLTYTFFWVSSSSLMGIPFLSGFFSKDLIIELLNSLPFSWTYFVYKCALYSAFFSSLYSIKLVYLVFISKPNASYSRYKTSEKFTFPMLFGMLFLMLGSIFSGFLFNDFLVSSHNSFLFDSIFSKSYVNKNVTFAEFYNLNNHVHILISPKIFPLYAVITSLFLYFVITFNHILFFKFSQSNYFFYLYSFFHNGLHFNLFYINTCFYWIINRSWNAFLLEKAVSEIIIQSFLITPLIRVSYYNNLLVKNRTSFEFIYMFSFMFLIICVILLI